MSRSEKIANAKFPWIWCIGGVFQLALIIASVAHISVVKYGWLGKVILTYGTFSAANSGYGYFAPNVGTEFKARFAITDRSGAHYTDSLESDLSDEANIRVANMFTLFRETLKDQSFQRGLVASWAGKMFERHPTADKVEVTVSLYNLPTMTEYHAGQRPSWKDIYVADFQR